MNRVDLHPEQLFDHLRDGSINSDDYALLSAHCGVCAPCRLELRLVFEPMGAPVPDREDRALGMAVVDRMLHSPERPAAPVSNVAPASNVALAPNITREGAANDGSDSNQAPGKRVRARVSAFQRGRSAAFIAAGIVLGCSMTAAALVPEFSAIVVNAVSVMVGLPPVRSRAAVQREPAGTLSSPAILQPSQLAAAGLDAKPDADSVAEGMVAEGMVAEGMVAEGMVAQGVVAQGMVADTRARGTGASREDRLRRAAQARSGKPRIDGADALLAAAARARARGAYEEAADYYRMLQRHYPNTEAEIVARVSLGRLLCLRLGQPQVALELFDDYLSQRPNGALGQEARSGRAQCLERLGQADEARAAWEELLERHPNSVYADEARVHLAQP